MFGIVHIQESSYYIKVKMSRTLHTALTPLKMTLTLLGLNNKKVAAAIENQLFRIKRYMFFTPCVSCYYKRLFGTFI